MPALSPTPAPLSSFRPAEKNPILATKHVSIWAREKVGKTHTALTWPEPIYFFDLDLGSEGIMCKFPEKKIYVAKYVPRRGERTVDEAEYLLSRFEYDYKDVLNNVSAGTVLVDTGTQINALVQKIEISKRLAKRTDQTVYPFDYGDANLYFENLLAMVKDTPLNFVVTHRAREQYAGKNPSGDYEAQQNQRVPYFVQTVLRLERIGKETVKPRGTAPFWYTLASKDKTRPVAVIESCRTKPELEGACLLEPSYNGLVEMLL